MRRKSLLLLLSVMVAAGSPSNAQVPDWVTQILAAAQLPIVANEIRREGVSNADVISVLDAMRTAGVPANDARLILDSARAARRDNGPVDNFGAFVQTQLASGKRGTELAAAIRAEHARQGKGRAGAGSANAQRGPDGRGPARGANASIGRGRGDAPKTPADTGAGRRGGARGRGRPPIL